MAGGGGGAGPKAPAAQGAIAGTVDYRNLTYRTPTQEPMIPTTKHWPLWVVTRSVRIRRLPGEVEESPQLLPIRLLLLVRIDIVPYCNLPYPFSYP